VARSIAIIVTVCLSVRLHVSEIARPDFTKFSVMLLVAVDRPFSDGSAICYVLPVWWIMSCFHIMERMSQNQRRMYICMLAAPGRSMPSPTASCF